MRILLIHQNFATPAEGGGTRHFELGRHCSRLGHDFVVVTSPLSYLSGRQTPTEGRTDAAEQVVEGVRIRYAYAHPSLHRSFVWRLFSFVSFTLSAIRTALGAGPADVAMGTSPPLPQAFSAWYVSRRRRCPFLLEIRDLWPEFAIAMGVLTNPVLVALARRLERFLYRRADLILVNSPAYREYLTGRGVPGAKIRLIPNGVDPTMFDPDGDGAAARSRWALEGRFVVVYAGALGIANDVATLLKAIAQLGDVPDVHLLLVGDGKERANLESLVQELGLTNVTFTGTLPKTEVGECLAAADACVAILQDIPMFRTTYPNKVFDYMAAGRPTILAIDGVIRQVVEEAGAGLYVQPGSVDALAEAIRTLAADRERARAMGRFGRAHVVGHFNRDDQANEFARLVEGLAASHRR